MAGTFAPDAGMRAIYVSTKNLYFHKTMGFERQNDRDPYRTKRIRSPFVGYELLIITICELFYGFSFFFSFSSSLSSPLMQWLFPRSNDYVLRAASTFNYTTPDD